MPNRHHSSCHPDASRGRFASASAPRRGSPGLLSIAVALSAALLAAGACCLPALAADPDFNRDILPILSDNCFPCHGPDERHREAELRLDTKEGAFRTTDGIAVVRPGNSSESELYRRIASNDPDEVMPPPDSQRKLSPAQIDAVRRWIENGAPWSEHWALVAPQRPALPQLGASGSSGHNPIDAFVSKRLDDEGLAFAKPADKSTLIRRVTLDLTGLPPTPDETAAFLADDSPNAYHKVVERLLASPRFGERMVWEWLDAARYADSNGYQGDGERTMYPWRDWAIGAFNDDLPYDQFTIWQLAGDLLPNANEQQRLATGFCRNHMINGEGGRIPEENRIEYVMDMTETMGTVWLGLTLTCTRCHDHKYDALSQRDYYGLFAFFNQTPVDGGGRDPQTPPILELPTPEDAKQRKQYKEQISAAARSLEEFETTFFSRPEGKPATESEQAKDAPEGVKKALEKSPAERTADQLNELEKHWEGKSAEYVTKLKQLRELVRARDELNRRIPRVMIMQDMHQPRETFLLTKGLYNKPADKVAIDVPASLPPLPENVTRNRLALAEWLVARENPLTARVAVNRIWQQFFGTGIVKTAEDFGVQGEKPSHPELLDWLAVEFRERGWSIKDLCRMIVTSATYRQDSRVSPALRERDPDNRLLARGARFRMPAWMLRDQALAASGLLVERVGGEPVKPYQPAGIWEEATFGKKKYQQDHGSALYRRSVYTFWRRIIGPTMFFDSATRQTCTVKQTRTNTPLHALATLNDVTYVEAARSMAERVLRDGQSESGGRIDAAFHRVLARDPTDTERTVLLASLERLRREYSASPEEAKKLLTHGESKPSASLDPVEHAAYTGVCLAILNLDETLTKE